MENPFPGTILGKGFWGAVSLLEGGYFAKVYTYMGWQVRRDENSGAKHSLPKGLSFDGKEINNPEDLLKALQASVPKKPKKQRNWFAISMISLAALVLLGIPVAFGYNWFVRPKSPIETKIANQVPFSVFAPTRLPSGFTFNKDSVKVISDEGQKILTYTVSNKAKSQTLNFTLQEEAKGYDYANLRKDRTVATQYGLANIKEDEFRQNTQVSYLAQPTMRSEKTWIIVTSSRQFPAAALDSILGSLKEQ